MTVGRKEGRSTMHSWLYKNHPRAAISNFNTIVAPVCMMKFREVDEQIDRNQEIGMSHEYWKDLLTSSLSRRWVNCNSWNLHFFMLLVQNTRFRMVCQIA
ncbi:hypothetical protein WG66_013502 [Moniliophthora roreri]|nr:hypothetical protein WG66_013502 [Moniliophthora roreri]